MAPDIGLLASRLYLLHVNSWSRNVKEPPCLISCGNGVRAEFFEAIEKGVDRILGVTVYLRGIRNVSSDYEKGDCHRSGRDVAAVGIRNRYFVGSNEGGNTDIDISSLRNVERVSGRVGSFFRSIGGLLAGAPLPERSSGIKEHESCSENRPSKLPFLMAGVFLAFALVLFFEFFNYVHQYDRFKIHMAVGVFFTAVFTAGCCLWIGTASVLWSLGIVAAMLPILPSHW